MGRRSVRRLRERAPSKRFESGIDVWLYFNLQETQDQRQNNAAVVIRSGISASTSTCRYYKVKLSQSDRVLYKFIIASGTSRYK